MKFLFQRVSTRRGERWREIEAPTARRHFVCRCGKPVFFRNSVCLACATPLGYDPDLGELLPLEPDGADGTWRHAEHPGGATYRLCANHDNAAGCNWLVPAGADGQAAQPLCRSCRLNRVIPDLGDPQNGVWWARIEVAKRRLVSSLLAPGLPVASKVGEDPRRGLGLRAAARGGDQAALRAPDRAGSRRVMARGVGLVALGHGRFRRR